MLGTYRPAGHTSLRACGRRPECARSPLYSSAVRSSSSSLLTSPSAGVRGEGEASESRPAWGEERARGGLSQAGEGRGSAQRRSRTGTGRGPRGGGVWHLSRSPKCFVATRATQTTGERGTGRAAPGAALEMSCPPTPHAGRAHQRARKAMATEAPARVTSENRLGPPRGPTRGWLPTASQRRALSSSQGSRTSNTNPADSQGGRQEPERSCFDNSHAGTAQPLPQKPSPSPSRRLRRFGLRRENHVGQEGQFGRGLEADRHRTWVDISTHLTAVFLKHLPCAGVMSSKSCPQGSRSSRGGRGGGAVGNK